MELALWVVVEMMIFNMDYKTLINTILLAPMRVLASGSAHARPSARPLNDASGNFWRTCL